jgi:hypothetical protein
MSNIKSSKVLHFSQRYNWFKKYSLDWPVPLHILLLAAFPVLFLYAYNIAQLHFKETLLPLGISLGGALLLWILLSIVLRNGRKAGLATALFILFFFSYGRLYVFLEKWDIFFTKHPYLLPGMLLIWGYCVYFINRAKRDFRITTTLLNVIAAALILINLVNITIYEVNKPELATDKPVEPTGSTDTQPNPARPLPDIYFIIMDEYAHPDANNEWCGYDNSSFIESLENKGFYIAGKSRTRTPHTPQCIAQVLNMEYLTAGWEWDKTQACYVEIESDEEEYHTGDPWDETTYQKIAYNDVINFLRSKGYKWVYFGPWCEVGTWDHGMEQNTDLYFNYYKSDGSIWVTKLQNLLWSTTMLRPFYYHITGGQYNTSWRRGVLGPLEHLEKIPSTEGPTFVFAHFFCPHAYFVFGANGEYVAPVNYLNFTDKQYYLGQYKFISTEIEKVVDTLLKKSASPPIIILQSDHGLRPHHPGIDIDSNAWHQILNAMYLPGMDNAVLYDSISPVNTFRLIFNYYFDADYPLLKDD